MKNPNGSDVPGARVLVEAARDGLVGSGGDHRIIALLDRALAKMARAKPVGGRAENTHRGWSDKTLKPDIAACVSAHPDWTRQQVSIYCNTNSARVSEFLSGLV